MTTDLPTRPPWADSSPMLAEYYDTEWGVPVRDEDGVFERLSLEAFQCGLSWATILRRRPAFREAFADFRIDDVAQFDDSRIEALMGNHAIIRNRRKIEATVSNARAAVGLREEGTDIAELVWSYLPDSTYAPHIVDDIPTQDDASRSMARGLKKRGFRFVGPTTCFALMESIGMHDTHLVGSLRRGISGLWEADGTRNNAPAAVAAGANNARD